MVGASLKSHQFRVEREETWTQLEEMLAKLERKSIRGLSDDEMIALPGLYRATLSSLNVARSISLDQDVIAYLESLTTRAYFIIYGSHTSFGKRASRFFRIEWPRAVQMITMETWLSLIITVLGALIAFVLVSQNPDWYFSFVPEGLAGDRNPAASAEELRNTLYQDENDKSGLSVFATYLFQHNSRVAILAFALGFAFALPSVALVLYNGLMLGAFVALFSDKGLGMEVGGWLIIHGATEIFAIVLAGAAGMHIGWSVAFPGDQSRMNAAASAGRRSAAVLGGVIIMLFCAGLLEGFGRQMINTDWIRYAIGFTTLTLWCLYFYLPRDFDALELAELER